jgi:HK97 family phage major capsid protein
MTQLAHPNADAVKIPKFTSGGAVAVHVDNAAVEETDAVTEEVSVSSYRLAGKQQLANRLVEFGASYDKAILADLGMAIATKRDFYVIQGTGSSQPEGIDASEGINEVTYTAGTATAAGLWPKLLKAIQEVHEGAFEGPDLIVMHPRRAAWLLAELDDSSRPFFTPVGPSNGMGVVDAGLAGTILGIPVVTSTNVPTALGSGTDEDEIIVGIARHGWLWTNTPRFAVSTEEKFGNDATVVKAVQDMMFTAERQPAAWSLITGTGLNDVL